MKLPNGAWAIIQPEKLFHYILNPDHPTHGGHAALFKLLLDIDRGNWHVLRDALVAAARDEDAVEGKSSAYGRKFEVRFKMTGRERACTILSVWIIESAAIFPRLVTAFVE